MGTSAIQQPSPQEIARIQANVAKMRAANAPESDVLAYLQHEDAQSAAAPDPNTQLSPKNIIRAATQGATLGWGDEFHLTSRPAEAAFKAAHPVADLMAKIGGGVVAPLAAAYAAPALGTTLGGAALLGAGTGAVAGAGDADGSLMDRAKGAAGGAAMGTAGGLLGYGAGKMLGAIGRAVGDRIHPERAVARASKGLLDPDAMTRLTALDKIAPEGASIATTSVPARGLTESRFTPMVRAMGASPKAAATAEGDLTSQLSALGDAKTALGQKMEQITGMMPQTTDLNIAVKRAREVLPSGTIPKGKLAIEDLRDALSRLRHMSSQAQNSANPLGVKLHEINQARDLVEEVLYQHAPGFEALDQQYGMVKGAIRQASSLLEDVQRSRGNYAANSAFKATSGSLGGSLPSGRHGVMMSLLDNILTNKAGAADAVARLITKPGGAEMIKSLMAAAPRASTRGYGSAVGATAVPAMRGLLSPADSPP